MLVAVISAKGSPGTTTVSVGLAARWPQGPGVVVEADPGGGDLAARFGMFPQPGLATMALAARHTATQPQPREWLQELPGGVPVVLAAPGVAATASLTALAGRGGDMLRLLAVDHSAVVVDAGRWRPSSAVDPLLAAVDVVLLVARPVPDEIRQCDVLMQALRELASDVRLVLVGEQSAWPAGEVGAALGVPVAGVMPTDRRGAGVLAGRMVPRRGWASKGWTRLELLRACYTLARRLDAGQTHSASVEQAGTDAAGGASPAVAVRRVDAAAVES